MHLSRTPVSGDAMHACTYPAGGPTGKENQATTQSVRSEEFVVFQGRPRSRVDQPTLRTLFRWRGFALLRQISHHAIDISLVLMQKETTKWGARTDRCFFCSVGKQLRKNYNRYTLVELSDWSIRSKSSSTLSSSPPLPSRTIAPIHNCD